MKTKTVNPTLDENSFKVIADLAYRESGLRLVAEKASMIQSRLRHRLRALELNDFERYANLVCSSEGLDERRQMISALTTNVSHFFREAHHFDILVKNVIPPLLPKLMSGGQFRVWSAGCSNGQEAYSIALSIAENFPELLDCDVRILATDIDPKVVYFGKTGNYPERFVSAVPKNLLSNHFAKNLEHGETVYQIHERLRNLVVFKELNLLSEWPMKKQMDAIFCRNVVIYFDLKTQNILWPRFRQQLSPSGYLFLGHSERISDPEGAGFLSDGPTSYRPKQ